MGRRSLKTTAVETNVDVDCTVALDDVDERISVLRKGRPPPEYTLEDFRDKFGLSAEGFNPHKSKDTKDILQSDLVAVFGPQKGKSGFFFGDCKNVEVKSAINRIYPVVYQHPHGPKNKLIGKDFAIGIVADVVKKLDVSWAAFALQTNCNQRSAWKKKMVTALEAKAELSQKTFKEVAIAEGFDDLLQGICVVKNEVLESPAVTVAGRVEETAAFISQRKTEIAELLVVIGMELKCIKKDVEEALKEKEDICKKVDSMRMALRTMGQTCEDCRSKIAADPDGAEAKNLKMTLEFFNTTLALQQVEFDTISAEESLKVDKHESLVNMTEFLEGQLASLTPQLISLKKGQFGISLHPHPITTSISAGLKENSYIKVTNCVVCDLPFPFSDILVCSCRHLYHPWCAITWFRAAWKCKEKTCDSIVHPNWYKSFGFVEPHAALGEKAEELDCEVQQQHVISERTTIAKGKLPDIGSSQPLPSGPVSMGTGVWSVGEASQAKTSRLKPRIEESRGREVEEDSAKITPDSDNVKKDARHTLGEPDSRVENLQPRALHADLGLGRDEDVAAAPTSDGEEDHEAGPMEEMFPTHNVEMPPTYDEDEDQELDEDVHPSGGGDTELLEITAGVGGETGEKLGERDQDRIVQQLRAEIAALKGQTPSPSAMKGQSESPSAPELGQKGVVRKIPQFKVWQEIVQYPVKTRSVAEVAPILKPIAKPDKVRTRGDGPAEEVDLKKSRKKSTKRKKGDLPIPSPGQEDEENVSIDGDQQLPPAKEETQNKKKVSMDLSVGLRTRKKKNVSFDLSVGIENCPIDILCTEGTQQGPQRFKYVKCNVRHESAALKLPGIFKDGEYCKRVCGSGCGTRRKRCPCAGLSMGGLPPYEADGLLHPHYIEMATREKAGEVEDVYEYCIGPDCVALQEGGMCNGHISRTFLKECNEQCGCRPNCTNRVVQRGLTRRLQIFWTNPKKEWGIRTLEDLPRGAFVFEYVGQIVSNQEMSTRPFHSKYVMDLDADWRSEQKLSDNEALCLDATKCGNVARFLNHRCYDANLIDIPMKIDSMESRYYHVAFFTKEDVKVGEELTWDYGINFDDEDQRVSGFRCCCNSTYCRDMGGV